MSENTTTTDTTEETTTPITTDSEVSVTSEFEDRESFNIYYTAVGSSMPEPTTCRSTTVGEFRREFNIPESHKVTVMMSSECDNDTPIEGNNFVNVNDKTKTGG